MKKAAKKGAGEAVTTAAVKSGEHVGKKASDKIVKLLSKSGESKKVTFNNDVSVKPVPKKMTDQEINQRVNQTLSGGAMRKRNII